MAENQRTRKRLFEIMATPEFLQLGEKRRAWVAKYIAHATVSGDFDAVAATRLVYTNANPRTVVTMSYAILSDKRVHAVLDLFFGTKRDPLDEILPQLATVIAKALRADKTRGRISVATMKALDFYESHTAKSGKSVAQPDASKNQTAEPRFKVGDLCTQDGQVFRVTSVDLQGHPLTADEVA